MGSRGCQVGELEIRVKEKYMIVVNNETKVYAVDHLPIVSEERASAAIETARHRALAHFRKPIA